MSTTLTRQTVPPPPLSPGGVASVKAFGVGSQRERVVHTGAEPRLVAVAIVRAAMIAVAAAVLVVDPFLDSAGRGRLGGVIGVWLLVLAVGEASRRAGVAVAATSRAGHLVDGLLVVAATVAAGGSASPLFFLAFVHVISVTLLASHLTGVKAAVWDSTLLLVAAAAETSGAIPFLVAGDGGQAATAVIRAVALILVTVVTAGASALNERELRRSRAGLETMLATGQALMGAQRADEALQIALAALTDPLGLEAAAVVVTSDAGAPLVARRLRGVESAPVASDRETVVMVPSSPMLRAHASDLGDPAVAALLENAANVLAVPVQGRLVHGVLAASVGGRPRAKGLPVRTLELVQSLAAQLSQTLDRITLSERIETHAAMDGLTQIANRGRFDRRFPQMLDVAARTDQPVSVLAVDIDHFKLVNDTHGHQAGDEVLKEVAQILSSLKRGDDFVARYGGEEFVLVLPVTDARGAVPIADRLRQAVARASTTVPVTISIGVASTTEHGYAKDKLFGAADAALYEAKHGGRNCVRVAARVAGAVAFS